MSVTQEIITTESGAGVLVAHLDDGKANALSTATIAAVQAAVAQAEADPAIAALVLHGRPGRFCAGFDLGVMRSGDAAAIVGLVSDGGDLVRRLYGCGVPVVAACTGHALAAGALLLRGCDLRIGADMDCKIGLNEVAIGMVLPGWAITIAQERLSRRHLQQAVPLAQVYDGKGAVDAGYLDAVVPEADVLAAAVARAAELAALDARAYAGTVRALRSAVLDHMGVQLAEDRRALNSPLG